MIRSFAEEDLPQAATLFARVFSLPPWSEDWSNEKAYSYIEDGFHCPGFVGFVMITDDSLVAALFGGCQGIRPYSIFKIAEIFVEPDYQQQGIGATLLNHLNQHLRKLSVQRITATTFIESPAAHFYLRQGFSDTGSVSYNPRKHIFEKTMADANGEE